MHMKPLFAALLALASVAPATTSLHAQAAPSAWTREFSLTIGATVSDFEPDYLGGPAAETNNTSLLHGIYGPSGFIDVRFRRWLQFEGEGRWMRFDVRNASNPLEVNVVPEDNYLAGPRFPIRVGRFTPYAKVLAGYGATHLQNAQGMAGSSLGGLAIAYGGGTDLRLSKHLSLRLIDFEYQQWFVTPPAVSPAAAKSITVMPYGASAGLSYRIF